MLQKMLDRRYDDLQQSWIDIHGCMDFLSNSSNNNLLVEDSSMSMEFALDLITALCTHF